MLHKPDIDEYCGLTEVEKSDALVETEVNSFDLLLTFYSIALQGHMDRFDACIEFTEPYCCFSFPEIDLRDVVWDEICDIAEELNISRRIKSDDYFVGAVIREYYKERA